MAELLSDAGLTGFVASSIADTAQGPSGWAIVSALVVTVMVLLYQTSALLRAIRAITALAWGIPVTRVPSPARSGLLFLSWLVVFLVVAASAPPVRHAVEFPLDLIANVVLYGAGLPVLWLVLSLVLSGRTSEGDLVLISTNWVATVYLLVGSVTIGVLAFRMIVPRRLSR